MTCSWFGFNAIVLTNLFELTFEFTPIVNDNKLRMGMTWEPFKFDIDVRLVKGTSNSLLQNHMLQQ
jgi:hypothetical protein